MSAPPTVVVQTAARARARRRGVAPRILVPILVIAVTAVAAIAYPVVVGFDPLEVDLLARLLPPGSSMSDGAIALLGTDQVGQDLLAQMTAGARVSLIVGVATLLLAGVIGVLLGMLAGWFGGWLDLILMRIADIQLAFPSILLAILIASVLGPGIVNVVIVLSISNWVVFARVARSQVLALKGREYVDAARTLGAGNAHLLFRTMLPGAMGPILVVATVEFGHVILAEAALSFLGVGVPMGTPSLGSTIANGTQYLGTAWWISTLPGLLLLVLVLSAGILGDALRDRFDPKLRGSR